MQRKVHHEDNYNFKFYKFRLWGKSEKSLRTVRNELLEFKTKIY